MTPECLTVNHHVDALLGLRLQHAIFGGVDELPRMSGDWRLRTANYVVGRARAKPAVTVEDEGWRLARHVSTLSLPADDDFGCGRTIRFEA